jgi:hypothetical protein
VKLTLVQFNVLLREPGLTSTHSDTLTSTTRGGGLSFLMRRGGDYLNIWSMRFSACARLEAAFRVTNRVTN